MISYFYCSDDVNDIIQTDLRDVETNDSMRYIATMQVRYSISPIEV